MTPSMLSPRNAAAVLLALWLIAIGVAAAPQPVGMRQETFGGAPQARELAGSVHRDLGCASCHGEAEFGMNSGMRRPSGRPPDPIAMCTRCHRSVAELPGDAHTMRVMAGDPNAPTCVTCHGSHSVQSRLDAESRTHVANIAAQCGTCHVKALDAFRQGVHAERLADGTPRGAVCASCHSAHQIAPASLAWSAVSRARVASTCGACHLEAAIAYNGSVHAVAVGRGDQHSPTCVDCHGNHLIYRAGDPQSPTSALQVSGATCARCHEPVSLTELHRLPAGTVGDFRNSFHGLAGAAGDRRVANCASCHGVHSIRPSWDPQSRVHEANLVTTCGQCHTGVAAGFARGGVHHLPRTFGHRLIDIVRSMYQAMIVGIITLMILHNGLDWFRRWKRRRAERRGPADDASGAARIHHRFSRNERGQHWSMAASFITLAITGFALKWGWKLPGVSAETSMDIRAFSHRAAAVVFILVAVYHVGYLAFTQRGRQAFRDMVPRLRHGADLVCCAGSCLRLGPPSTSDWRDLIQTVKYNAGLSRTPPRFGRFSYAEKMEYFALVWGSIVMIGTGLTLWFEVPFLNRFPYWGFELSSVVHYYEAILATLAILVWHFYFTILNPDVFPISKAMLTGDLTGDQMAREHPRELESIDAAEACRRRQ